MLLPWFWIMNNFENNSASTRRTTKLVLCRPIPNLCLLGLSLCLLFSSCGRWSGSSTPAIVFGRVPPVAAVGDSDKLATIDGRVTGVRPGQQILLYARSE